VASPEERDPYGPPPEDGTGFPRPADGPPAQPPSDRPVETPPPYGQPPSYGAPSGQLLDSGTGQDWPPDRTPGSVDPGGRRALLFAVAGAVMSVVFFPVGIVLDVAAIVLAFRARRRAAKAGGTAPMSAPAVVIGGIGLAFASGLLAFTAIFFDEFRAYQLCMSGANTEVARQECNDEFRIDVENRLG
jgi:hypothetical protein